MIRPFLLLALPLLMGAARSGPVTANELSHTVKAIASDPFQGRAPGTQGEIKTIQYLVTRLQQLGLEPAGQDGAWTQTVPMIHNVPQAPRALSVQSGTVTIPLMAGTDIAPTTARATTQVKFAGAPLVFVGYGVTAPEHGWDDFKGVDLHGKIAVFLVNDPDYDAQPGDDAYGQFGGKAMTYYGRWTYKYEEAARHGAIGALIVHDAGAAGYGWNVAGNSVGGTYALSPGPGQPRPVELAAWISAGTAQRLFKQAGLNLTVLSKLAKSRAFRPVPIGDERLTIDMPVRSETIESRNVLARISGTDHPDETIIFGAHWDAYGVGAPDAKGRTIRPGANDDGLGVAAVLGLARQFAAGPKPQRTLVFALWTAEERGLLGSEYYAQHPIFPLDRTVADLTVDILETAGPARDVVLIGAGQDSLDGNLASAATAQGRTVTPDSKPERGLFYRADHFSLAKRGVPTLLLMGAGGGADLIRGGRAQGDKWVNDYTAQCYHQTCDTWSAHWDLRGAAQDVALLYAIGADLATSRSWPSWTTGSEFKELRDQSQARRP